MVKELQLEPEFVAGDRDVKRYIYRYGALRPAPFSPGGLLMTRLVSLTSKVRMVTEALRTTQPQSREETVAEFVTRKFGADVVDNLADPIISTIFFGDAYRMGMESAFPALAEWERRHGSMVRGAIHARNTRRDGTGKMNSRSMKVTDSLPSLGSFRLGMARLPERIAEELREEMRYSVRVETVTPSLSDGHESWGKWRIRLASGEAIAAEQVVLSLPAYEAARVLQAGVPALARELKAIEYSAMGGVASGYDRGQVKNALDGFGFMVPRKEGLKTICTFWNSSLFPGRAPGRKVLMTSFVRSDSGSTDEGTFARSVESENAKILGIEGEPAIQHVWIQPQALPQYNVGHSERVAAIRDMLPTLPNLHLAGNYLKGRSIGDCVEVAFDVAERVHSQIGVANVQAVTRSSEE
jgi:oxygen-dependent protoporphyrinogen oxidase